MASSPIPPLRWKGLEYQPTRARTPSRLVAFGLWAGVSIVEVLRGPLLARAGLRGSGRGTARSLLAFWKADPNGRRCVRSRHSGLMSPFHVPGQCWSRVR